MKWYHVAFAVVGLLIAVGCLNKALTFLLGLNPPARYSSG